MPSRFSFFGLLPVAVVLLFASLPLGTVATSGTVIIPADRVIEEDLFAAGSRVFVEGTIRGDLITVARRVVVAGVVEGDVLGLAMDIDVIGEVGGSVRTVSWRTDTAGTVDDDLMTLSRHTEVDGAVGRDFLTMSISADVDGSVARELRGELLWGLTIDGAIGRNVDVGAHRLRVGETASVRQTLAYRQGVIGQNIDGWAGRFEIHPDADVGVATEVDPLPATLAFRAARNLLQVLRLLGFMLVGVVAVGVMPVISARSSQVAQQRFPAATGLGLAAIVITPLVVIIGIGTIVLVPFAIALGALWFTALFVGAVPAVMAFGRWLTRDRRTLVAAVIVGALVWRILRMLPLLGFVLYWLFTAWGIGSLLLLGRRWWRERSVAPAAAPDDRAGRMELLGLASADE